ncbi:MAG: M60 family peptidase N-terminal accessory domain-containing protein [Myxococcota bacterium]
MVLSSLLFTAAGCGSEGSDGDGDRDAAVSTGGSTDSGTDSGVHPPPIDDTPLAPPTPVVPDDPIPPATSDLADIIRELIGHVDGRTLLTNARLTEIHNILKGDEETNPYGLDEFDDDVGAIELGIDLIADYEDQDGPLFTSEGVQNFPSAAGENDTSLERAIHQVYLGIFDAIDADLLATHPALIGGLAYGSASYFPGEVPVPEDAHSIYVRTINTTVPEDYGRPMMYSERDAVRPTGAYLAPGTIGEILVPEELQNKGYRVRVGSHTWDLSEKRTSRRLARVVKEYDIEGTVTRVANPVGGNIYIMVPVGSADGLVNVQFRNTGRSPLYTSLPYSLTNAADWETERLHPGAWADFETERVMLNVPARWVRDFDTPAEVMNEYDRAMNAVSELMAKPEVRPKPPLFLQVDTDLRGSAFFPGYPMSNFPHFNQDNPRAPLSADFVHDEILWHEHGHAAHITKFNNEVEAIVHLLNVYIENTVYERPLVEAYVTSLGYIDDDTVTMADVFNTWVLTEGFLNGDDMIRWDTNYQLRGYAHYIDMVDLFGWNSMIDFNDQLNMDYPEVDFPRNAHEDDDRIYRLSVAAGADLRPLYHMWGRSPNNPGALQRRLDDAGLEHSSAVYDKLVAYRDLVPANQTEFDAFFSKMEPLTNQVRRADYWDGLEANYPPSLVQDVLARIEEIMAIYYPDGRP